MPKVPLLGGAYSARGIIASAQESINLYGEKNPEDATTPFAHYPTPGLALAGTPQAPVKWSPGGFVLPSGAPSGPVSTTLTSTFAWVNTWEAQAGWAARWLPAGSDLSGNIIGEQIGTHLGSSFPGLEFYSPNNTNFTKTCAQMGADFNAWYGSNIIDTTLGLEPEGGGVPIMNGTFILFQLFDSVNQKFVICMYQNSGGTLTFAGGCRYNYGVGSIGYAAQTHLVHVGAQTPQDPIIAIGISGIAAYVFGFQILPDPNTLMNKAFIQGLVPAAQAPDMQRSLPDLGIQATGPSQGTPINYFNFFSLPSSGSHALLYLYLSRKAMATGVMPNSTGNSPLSFITTLAAQYPYGAMLQWDLGKLNYKSLYNNLVTGTFWPNSATVVNAQFNDTLGNATMPFTDEYTYLSTSAAGGTDFYDAKPIMSLNAGDGTYTVGFHMDGVVDCSTNQQGATKWGAVRLFSYSLSTNQFTQFAWGKFIQVTKNQLIQNAGAYYTPGNPIAANIGATLYIDAQGYANFYANLYNDGAGNSNWGLIFKVGIGKVITPSYTGGNTGAAGLNVPGPFYIGTPVGGVRGLWFGSNGKLYAVVGTVVYSVDESNNFTGLGPILSNQSTPVSIADNGLGCMIVDGTRNGYFITYSKNGDKFSVVADPNFYGGDWVDFIDGYFVLNKPGTDVWYCSGGNYTAGANWNGLFVGTKQAFSDPIQAIVVLNREVWVIGTMKSEVWYDAGNAQFPFSPIPGAVIEHGTCAKYSVARMDTAVYFLGQEQQGRGVVFKTEGYNAKRISTHAIEEAFRTYPRIDDARGFVYQQGGHYFYQLNFPTANVTWVYDMATDQWHRRASIDANGNLNRHRANCHAFAYSKNYVGDYQLPNLYLYDEDTYTDNGQPIPRIRTFPHIMQENKRVHYLSFQADLEVGDDLVNETPMVNLSWSDDRGKTYGNALQRSMGALGQYLKSPQWLNLGMARDRVFKISWSAPAKTTLQGAWIDVEGSES